MGEDEKSPLDEPSWSFSVQIREADRPELLQPTPAVQVQNDKYPAKPSLSHSSTFKQRFVTAAFFPFFERHFALPDSSSRLIDRLAHTVRTYGWLITAPLAIFILLQVGAPWPWLVVVTVLALVFPPFATILILRSKKKKRMALLMHCLEAIYAALLLELTGFDVMLVIFFAGVLVITASASGGLRNSLTVIGVGSLTAILLYGRVRTGNIEPFSQTNEWIIGGTLILFFTGLGYGYFLLFSGLIRAKKSLQANQDRMTQIHQQVVESIVQPFASDEMILHMLAKDISDAEREKFRKHIRARQQMESLGHRAASVAHDVRNLLQPILILVEMLREHPESKEEAEDLLGEIQSATLRSNDALGQLRRLPERVSGAETCNVVEVVKEVYSLHSKSAGSSMVITLGNEVPSGVHPEVGTVPTVLHQAINNLVVNGLQAMDGAGVLEINVGLEEPGAMLPLIDVSNDMPVVRISVRDTGCGMTEEVCDRIFEPYFTTKASGGGTGLGLASTHAVVTLMGGVVRVQSKVAVGTQFSLILPTVSASPK